MKIANCEFLRELVTPQHTFKHGYLMDIVGLGPFFLRHGRKHRYSSEAMRVLRQGQKMGNVGIYNFQASNVESLSAQTLGLPDGPWECQLNIWASVGIGNKGVLSCSWIGFGLLSQEANGQWVRARLQPKSRWGEIQIPQQGAKFMDDLAESMKECEGLLEFIVSPARHFEYRELCYEADINALMSKVDAKKKHRDGQIEKKNKVGGYELK